MTSTAPFSMGTSMTNPLSLSLDDIIKNRRKEDDKKATERKRTNIKAKGKVNQKDSKPTNAEKSMGSNKAKRNANMAAKRGLSQSSKATPMQVEREVYRQARGGGPKTRSADQPRRSERNRNAGKKNASGSNKSIADQKMKAKNLKKKQQQQNQQGVRKDNAAPAPTRKAATAAKKALREAGFQPPKGMKMVISYVSTDSGGNAKGDKKNMNQKQKQQQQKNKNNNNSGNKNSRRTGRR